MWRGCLQALPDGRAASGNRAISLPSLGSSDSSEERESSSQDRATPQKDDTNCYQQKKHLFADLGRMGFPKIIALLFSGAQGTPPFCHTELLQCSPTRCLKGFKSFRWAVPFFSWVDDFEGLHKPEPIQAHNQEQQCKAH